MTGASACITCMFAVEVYLYVKKLVPLILLKLLKIFIKIMAFTTNGFWQSRRNRVDTVITVVGLLWCAAHAFAVCPLFIIMYYIITLFATCYT